MKAKKLLAGMLALVMTAGLSLQSIADSSPEVYSPASQPRIAATKLQLTEDELEMLNTGEAVPSIHKQKDGAFLGNRAGNATSTPLAYSYDARVVKLKIDFGDGRGYYWQGTGFMYGSDVVGTVAHNFKHPELGYAKGMIGYVGLDSDGSCWAKFEAKPSQFFYPTKWDSTGGYVYDYGAIKLTEQIGNTSGCGWFGLGTYSDSQLETIQAKFIGYGERTYKPMGSQGNLVNIGTYDFYYSLPAGKGDSGAPIYRPDGNIVVGIHAYGTSAGVPLLSATRIHRQAFNDLITYKNM